MLMVKQACLHGCPSDLSGHFAGAATTLSVRV